MRSPLALLIHAKPLEKHKGLAFLVVSPSFPFHGALGEDLVASSSCIRFLEHDCW